MNGTVPRTCTVVPPPAADGNAPHRPELSRGDSRPLADFRSHGAYVLLGDPGAGKTTAFEGEVEALGTGACHMVSARDFLTIGDPSTVPPGTTLLIDGLDEVRAGEADARTPLDRIRERLAEFGRPRFRLSCREADWLGENDRRHLAKVSPDEKVTVLRLDPLTEADIRKILAHRDDVPGPGDFVSMARDRGVDGLLASPQTLGMLADVVGGGGAWPRSRLETFEHSCRGIAREHNEEHYVASLASVGPPDVDRTLDAAGRLCALQLLTGAAGSSMLPGGSGTGWLSPDQCDYEQPLLLRHALRTKLFKGEAHGRLIPVHRHVAEYLAGRHLGRLVDERKLPAGRIVSLMTGADGTVVTEMRGLSAWFAAQCRAARPLLIDRDPTGVVQYGDVSRFTDAEKQSLLGALERDLPALNLAFGLATRLGALATPGMETAFKDLLSTQRRGPERQVFVGLLMQALIDGAALTGLSDSLLQMVRDPSWQSSIRMNALRAYAGGCHDDDRTNRLKTLLQDIRQGKVDDPDDDLLGVILLQLYPGELTPRELWECFAERRNPSSFGPYARFWTSEVVNGSPGADVAEHLDILSQRSRSLQARGLSDGLRRLRLGLLARGLFLHGDRLVRRGEVARLHDWLGVATTSDLYVGGQGGHEEQIRAWLEERPAVQKAIQDRTRGSDRLQAALAQAKRSHIASNASETEFVEMRTQYERKKTEERRRELDYLRSQESALADQQAAPGLLYQLARVYFGDFQDIASDKGAGARAIEARCAGDRSPTEAILVGFRGVPARPDVPTLNDVVRVCREGRVHPMGLPFLAGLAELERCSGAAGTMDPAVSEASMRLAVAFLFTNIHGTYAPSWYQTLLDERPDTVADVQTRIAWAAWRGSQPVQCKLWELAFDPAYERVARLSALKLLRAFPVQHNRRHAQELEYLLIAALQHSDEQGLREMIDSKLAVSSLDVWQRARWLAAGWLAWPESFADALRDHALGSPRGREQRLADLSAFVSHAGSKLIDRLEGAAWSRCSFNCSEAPSGRSCTLVQRTAWFAT